MKALHKLNELNEARINSSEAKDILFDNIVSPDAHSFLDRAAAAVHKENALWDEWKKIPSAKRTEAEEIHKWAMRYMDTIANAPRAMSGTTNQRNLFGATDVSSTTSKGDRYSRRVTYRKTDVTHTVSISPEDCEYLWKNKDLIEMFPREVRGHRSFLLNHNPKTHECAFASVVREKLELRRGYLYVLRDSRLVGVGNTLESARREAFKYVKLEAI